MDLVLVDLCYLAPTHSLIANRCFVRDLEIHLRDWSRAEEESEVCPRLPTFADRARDPRPSFEAFTMHQARAA